MKYKKSKKTKNYSVELDIFKCYYAVQNKAKITVLSAYYDQYSQSLIHISLTVHVRTLMKHLSRIELVF